MLTCVRWNFLVVSFIVAKSTANFENTVMSGLPGPIKQSMITVSVDLHYQIFLFAMLSCVLEHGGQQTSEEKQPFLISDQAAEASKSVLVRPTIFLGL